MRRFLIALVIAGSMGSTALADDERSRAAVRVSTHIAGQLTSLGICAGIDSANATAYRSAASAYEQDSDVSAADSAAQKILAEDARQTGGDQKRVTLTRQRTEAALAQSLRDAAAADKPRFITACRDELQSFNGHSGSFAPLTDLFPYEMKLILIEAPAQ